MFSRLNEIEFLYSGRLCDKISESRHAGVDTGKVGEAAPKTKRGDSDQSAIDDVRSPRVPLARVSAPCSVTGANGSARYYVTVHLLTEGLVVNWQCHSP